jgi:hypothetical protein
VRPGKAVTHHRLTGPRKTLIPIRTGQFKTDKDPIPIFIGIGLPQELIESPAAPVEGMGSTIILVQAILRTLDGKPSSSDPVSKTADGNPKIGGIMGIGFQTGISQKYILLSPVPGGNQQGSEACPESGKGQGEVPGFQGIEIYLLS